MDGVGRWRQKGRRWRRWLMRGVAGADAWQRNMSTLHAVPSQRVLFVSMLPSSTFGPGSKTVWKIRAWGSGSFSSFAMLPVWPPAARRPIRVASSAQAAQCEVKPLRILFLHNVSISPTPPSQGCMRLQASYHCDGFSLPFLMFGYGRFLSQLPFPPTVKWSEASV